MHETNKRFIVINLILISSK